MSNKRHIIHAISMIRNEADIISMTLRQSAELFDKFIIIDVHSTDGTRNIIDQLKGNCATRSYNFNTQEKYQAALMNALLPKSFEEGADWVFLLDADEFININSRDELDAYLSNFSSDIMHLPWINLVPTSYGQFNFFDFSQKYYWSGRFSPFSKVAISSRYYTSNPDFRVSEGNHLVMASAGCCPEKECFGLSLLHIPVRSVDRLVYKLVNAKRLTESKHNAQPQEGSHVFDILGAIAEGGMGVPELNAITAYYGKNDAKICGIMPHELSWPMISLPNFLLKDLSMPIGLLSLTDTNELDSKVIWNRHGFVRGSKVKAEVLDNDIRMLPQPMLGSGKEVKSNYTSLPEASDHIVASFDMGCLFDAIKASMNKIDVNVFSAWTGLVPALYALFSLLKPRRFVELGTHNGMSFFSACYISQMLNINTQCVAINNWQGDGHAGFHTRDVFEKFQKIIGQKYPKQNYIESNFDDAVNLFEEGSVDLLHIDGLYTYSAVKHDFDMWLPKMSKCGVIIFHGINDFTKNFGVWKLWDELKSKYPAMSLCHNNGLGILYTGSSLNGISKIFYEFQENRTYFALLQEYLGSISELSIDLMNFRANINGLLPCNELAERSTEASNIRFNFDGFSPNKLNKLIVKLISFLSKIICFGPIANYSTSYELICNSGLFDKKYYLANNLDVNSAGVDPIAHYLIFGCGELRNPSNKFDTKKYLLENIDVSRSGINPLVHYIKYGQHEGRTEA